MKIAVGTRVHRILKKLPSFRVIDNHSGFLSQLRQDELPTTAQETLLGAYENHRGNKEGLVLFSDQAVYWLLGPKWHGVKYHEIATIDRPAGEKMDASELLLKTRTGALERLPIRGGTENTRDVFEVWRFIMRVTEDLARPEK